MRLFTFTILVVVVVWFKEINGEPGLNVTILTDLPLDGEICAGQSVNFLCRINSGYIATKHQWIVDNKEPVTRDRSHVIQVFSKVKVTCIVTAILNRDPSNKTVTARDSVIALPGGGVPKATFPYLGNYVNYPTGTTANLTATVVSTFPLTELTWSPPPYYSHPKNETNTTKAGNITTTILSIPNIQIKNIGNYTLTTVNKCGKIRSYLYMDIYTDCHHVELRVPPLNFTVVEGLNSSFSCHFKGWDSLSSSIGMRAQLPNGKRLWMFDNGPEICGCMLQKKLACSPGVDPDDCCAFDYVLTCASPVNCSGTLFSCVGNFSNYNTAQMTVLPSPKVVDAPSNVNAHVGSTVKLHCGFQTTTNTSVAHIHWLYNGEDIEIYKRTHNFNTSVTNVTYKDSYMVSTLIIYSVQRDNVGEYSCYCSYDTTKLDVDHPGTITSNVMSANLDVSDKPDKEMTLYFIVGAAVILGVIMILLVFGVIIRIRLKSNRRYGYQELPGVSSNEFSSIGDEVLEQYIVEDLCPYWHNLGRKLKLPQSFLDNTFEQYPSNPTEQLRAVLHEWRARTTHPTAAMLDRSLEELGVQNFIPGRRLVLERSHKVIHHHTEHHAPDDRQLPVSGPGCQMFINRNSQILPGVDSQNTEISTFKGTLRGGLPPLTVLSPDLQVEWEELGLHMNLDLEALRCIKEENTSQTIACCLEVFVHWLIINAQATWDDFVAVLQEDPLKWNTIASGLAQHLNNIIIDSDGRSTKKKKRQTLANPLQKHYAKIVEHIDPEQLLLLLKTHDLVTSDEEYMLLNNNLSPQRRTKLFLQRFCSKNPKNSVWLFYQCLREEKQHSGHKYLADLLEQDVYDYEAKASNKTKVPKKAEKTNKSVSFSTSSEGENNDLSEVIKSCWMQVADMMSVPPNMVHQISAISQDPLMQANLFLRRYTEHAGSHARENIIRALDQLGTPVNRL